jgi:hypothetical protein
VGFTVIREGGCTGEPTLSPGSITFTGRFWTEFSYDPVKDVIAVFLYQKVIAADGVPIFPERDAFKALVARVDRR